MGGNLSDFEAALRAFYAGDRAKLSVAMAAWPADIRLQVESMIDAASLSS